MHDIVRIKTRAHPMRSLRAVFNFSIQKAVKPFYQRLAGVLG
jgi:hypothetical protein